MSVPVFIIIPAFNEAERITSVVRSLRERSFDHVVVVDDGSEDETAERARAAGAQVISHALNRGQGAALETGNAWARAAGAQTVVHFDGDGQFNPDDIASAVAALYERNVDVVLGSRFLDERSTTIPWTKRRLLLPLARFANRLLTGVALTDAHNGFRVLSQRALNTIHVVHDGMAHNSDIVAQIKRHGLRYLEHPVEVRYHEFGQSWRGGYKIVRDWCMGWFVS